MNKPIGVGIILLNSKREVLLFLRDDKPTIPFPNIWDLPGGHPEEAESPEDGIRREMMEEMDLELGEIKFFRKYEWSDFDEYIFWKEIDLDIASINLHEGQRLAYFSPNEIDDTELAFHYNQMFKDFFEGRRK